MLGQGRRRWANVTPTSCQHLVFARTVFLATVVKINTIQLGEFGGLRHQVAGRNPQTEDAHPTLYRHLVNVSCLLGTCWFIRGGGEVYGQSWIDFDPALAAGVTSHAYCELPPQVKFEILRAGDPEPWQ